MLKIRRKDGMIMEEDLLNVIEEEWETIEVIFADDKDAMKYSLAALGFLIKQLGWKRVVGSEPLQ